MNPVLVASSGVVSYAGWRGLKWRDPLGCWVVLFGGGVFVPYVALSVVSDRVSSLHYAVAARPDIRDSPRRGCCGTTVCPGSAAGGSRSR